MTLRASGHCNVSEPTIQLSNIQTGSSVNTDEQNFVIPDVGATIGAYAHPIININ